VGSLGSTGDEARSLVATLSRHHVDAAMRADAPSWVGPALGEADWQRLLAAHVRSARPDALIIRVGSPSPLADPGGPSVLRLAGPCDRRPDGALAWVVSAGLRDELIGEGWPSDAIAVVPPVGIVSAVGPGGGGVLAILPCDLGAAVALLRALSRIGCDRVQLLPAIRSVETQRLVADHLPRATLLSPVTDERRLAERAAGCDVVIALNPDDRFDRQALVAAAAGAAVVVRRHGPAHSVLGAHAHSAELGDEAAIVRATNAAFEQRGDRAVRAAAVEAGCGWPALAEALALAERQVAIAPAAAA
jgi:hypothetical protein